jgi:hypothetical protein
MFKFDLGDKVFVKSQGVEGTIVGKRWESSREAFKIDYEIMHQYDCTEDYMYVGKKNVYIRVVESDLVEIPVTVNISQSDSKQEVSSKVLSALKNKDFQNPYRNITDTDFFYLNGDGFKFTDYYTIMKDALSIKKCDTMMWVGQESIHDIPDEGHCDDHLDALRYVAYALEPKGIDSCEITVDLNNIKTCDHRWLPYEGLTQRFDYCEKCDEKR